MNAGPRVTGGPQQRGCSTDLSTLLGTPAGADATAPTALFSTPKALLPLPSFSKNCLSTIRQKHATVVIQNCFTSILIIEITEVRTCNARKVRVQFGNIGGVLEHQGSIYGFEIFLSVSVKWPSDSPDLGKELRPGRHQNDLFRKFKFLISLFEGGKSVPLIFPRKGFVKYMAPLFRALLLFVSFLFKEQSRT